MQASNIRSSSIRSSSNQSTSHPAAIKIDQETKDRYKRLAEERKRTPHWMMKEAIMSYLDREEKREAFHQEAKNSWEEYQATGLHLTFEEVDEWLTQLAEGNDIDPPACHA